MYRRIIPTTQQNYDEVMILKGIIKTLNDDNKNLNLRVKYLEDILKFLTRDMETLKRNLDSLNGSLNTQPILVSPSPIYYSSYGNTMMYDNIEAAEAEDAESETAEVEAVEVKVAEVKVAEVEVAEVEAAEVEAAEVEAAEIKVAKKKNKSWADLSDDDEDSDDEDNKDTSPNDNKTNDIKTNDNKWKTIIGKNHMTNKSQDDNILNFKTGGVKTSFTPTSINHSTKNGNLTHLCGVIEIFNIHGIDKALPKPQEQHRKSNYGKIQDTPTTIYFTDDNGIEKELEFPWFCGYVFWNTNSWPMWILNEAAVFGKKIGITFNVNKKNNKINPEFYSIKNSNKKNSSSHKVFSYKDNHYMIIKKYSNMELKQLRKDYFNKKFRPFIK